MLVLEILKLSQRRKGRQERQTLQCINSLNEQLKDWQPTTPLFSAALSSSGGPVFLCDLCAFAREESLS
jgi:hypothetical protein